MKQSRELLALGAALGLLCGARVGAAERMIHAALVTNHGVVYRLGRASTLAGQ